MNEYRELLADLDVAWVSLDDVGITWDVEETGSTFEENAELKAAAYARASHQLTLADDSGLEVDALRGRPGVYTARFGGEELTSEQRYHLLLKEMAGIPWEERGARFRCVVALANENGVLATSSGSIAGRIALEPNGVGGFGYDPVFYITECETTMAQLPAALKNRISHRARALEALGPHLQRILGN